MRSWTCHFCLLFLLLWFQFSLSQDVTSHIHKKIERLIEKDSLELAFQLLTNQLNISKEKKEYHTIIPFIETYGNLAFLIHPELKMEEVISFLDIIPKNSNDAAVLHDYYFALALIHGNQNNIKEAIAKLERAKKYGKLLDDKSRQTKIDYHLGYYSLKQGNYDLFFKYINTTAKLIEKEQQIVFDIAPEAFNLKGGIMHLTSKPDSANYYFKKAINYGKKLEPTLKNKFSTPSIILSNWFLAKQASGEYQKAQEYLLESIRLKKRFLAKSKNPILRKKAFANLSRSYRNMTSLMYHLGSYEKSKYFSQLGYNIVKSHLDPKDIGYFHGILLMAETSINYGENDEALLYLEEAENALQNVEGDNINWYSQLYAIYGNAYFYREMYEKALVSYKKYEYYRLKNGVEELNYDDIYLKLNTAISYAYSGEDKEAMLLAENIQNYASKKYGESSFLANDCISTLLKVNIIAENYRKTLSLAEKSLQLYDKANKDKILNTYYFEHNKPVVLFSKAQSQYHLANVKSEKNLLPVLETLEQAIQLLEKRKTFTTTIIDVNFLLSEYRQLIDFTKKVYVELYELTKKNSYLNKLLELHESAIYSRIRARLNLREVLANGISKKTMQRETKLKEKINKFFNEDVVKDDNIISAINSIEEWSSFQDSLQQNNPKYYNLRYATKKNLALKIPDSTSVLRYIFIDKKLYVILLTIDRKEIFPLNFEVNKKEIASLNDFKTTIVDFNTVSNKLYRMLWQPFSNQIDTDNIIIIPDQILFNLSFELLTPKNLESFGELAKNDLLTKYNISYNYSLELLKNREIINFENDFVAFAPKFDSKMKSDYKIAVKDSIELDKTYISLLPQPFSAEIAKKYGKLFNGESFLNEKASKKIFVKTAKEHKIIHIGTHAESNNVSPELSRLVFAKDISDSTNIDDNYLYTYEIYNQDLSSNLAILTACETGKPTYQPGEGMISLAHAFNYAGSESILTSLWQIDEQSSTKILEYFYSYLEDGLPKDEALRNAKLDYLKNAKGRTLHPQYWAGLILIGDVSPITLTTTVTWPYWIIGVLVVLLTLLFLKNKKLDNN